MFCPNCGKEIKEGKFCMNCGTKLPNITEEMPSTWEEEKKLEKSVFCPNCGKEIKEGNFCIHCGTKLPPVIERTFIAPEKERKLEKKEGVSKTKLKFQIPTWAVVLIIFASILVVVGISWLVYLNMFSYGSSSSTGFYSPGFTSPLITPSWHLVDTYDKDLEIPSTSYTYLSVIFEKGQKVKGEVRLLEGDDISYFYIVNGENFYKFKNNENFYPIVSKKAERYFKFEFLVPETGTYYFIAGNTAWFGTKEINVSYEVYEYY